MKKLMKSNLASTEQVRSLIASVVLQAVEDIRGRHAGWEPQDRHSAIRFLLSDDGKHCLSYLGISTGCIEEFRKDLRGKRD